MDFHIPLRNQDDDEDDEQQLDFTFDGTVHFGARLAEGGRSKIVQLRRMVDAVLSREATLGDLQSALKGIIKNVDSAIAEHADRGRRNSKLADLHAAYREAYTRARDALSYMNLYIDSDKRSEYLTQGIASLESAVEDIDGLITYERSQE